MSVLIIEQVTAFLRSEKKIAERSIINLSESRKNQKDAVSHWRTEFNSYQDRSLWYLPYLAYTAVRLELKKSKLKDIEERFDYFIDINILLVKALDSLSRGNFDDTLFVLERIIESRPLDDQPKGPGYKHAGDFSRPRETAEYLHEQLSVHVKKLI